MSRSPHTWSFRALLFVQGALIAAAPLAVVALVGWRIVVPQLTAAVETHHLALTRATASQIETHLGSARREVVATAALIESVADPRTGGRWRTAEVDRILDAMVGSGQLYEAVYLAGSDGVVGALGLPVGRRGARRDLRGIDLSRREFVMQAVQTGDLVWSSSFLSAVSGRLAIALALPIARGVLVAEIALGPFSYFLRELPVGGAVSLLVDRRGVVIAHPRPDLAAQQISLADQGLVREAFSGSSASGRFRFDGRAMIGSAWAIRDLGWVVLVAQPVASAFRLLDTASLVMLGGFALAVVLALAAAYVLAGTSSRRLGVFARNAGALADGRDDLVWPPTRIAEFICLGDDLRRMADAVQAREAALRRSESRYREVVESSTDLITQVDAEGRFLFVNQTAARVFGRPAEQCVGRLAFDFVHPDDRSATQESFVRWLASKTDAMRFENRQLGADGRVFSIVWSIHAHRNAEGEIVEFSSIGHDMTEYRRAESEIRRLALVASSTSNAVLITDAEGRVEWVNTACEHLTGYPLRELRGDWPWRRRVASEEQGALLDWMVGEIAAGRGFNGVELKVRRCGGEARWHEIEAQPVRDARGRLIQFVVIESDVTARRSAQDALRASEERLRATLENTPNVSVRWYDEDGRVTYWNPSAERLFGIRAGDAVGRTLDELIWTSGEAASFKAMLDGIARSGVPVGPYESTFRRPDGSTGWILCTTFAIPEEENRRRFVCMDIDITEQKVLMLALRESEQKFLAVFHASPVPIAVSNLATEGVVLADCNPAWEREFGYRRDEVVGRAGPDFDFWVEVGQRAELIGRLRTSGVVEDMEVHVRRADGEALICLASGRTATVGALRMGVVAYRDVTEERRIARALRDLNAGLEDRVAERTAALAAANEELRETLDTLQRAQDELIRSEKLAALGALVAGVAHELNTPIGNGLMAATTLDDHAREFERALHTGSVRKSMLERFVLDAMTATGIVVRNLLKASELVTSFKQVAVDQTSAQRREFDLADLVSEIVLTLRPSFKRTPYVVDYAIPEGLRLDSYPGPLGQVLANLINNALVHGFEGRQGGTVRIAAAGTGGGRVRIEVEDDGRGIAREHLSRIFDPFFTTKLGKGGSGLGLHIVHNIVTRMLGGEIRVDSSSAGTRFAIDLPCRAPDQGD